MSDCFSIVLGMFRLTTLLKLVYLSVACGAISMTLSKAAILNRFHEWLEKKSPFLEEMLSCPWCTSHWVALILTLVYQPLVLDWADRPAWQSVSWLTFIPLTFLDYLVTTMVMVTLASVAARIIHSAYKPIMG